MAAKIAELGLGKWYLEEGWQRRKYKTDGWAVLALVWLTGSMRGNEAFLRWGSPYGYTLNPSEWGLSLRGPPWGLTKLR